MARRKSITVEFSPRWGNDGEVVMWVGRPTGDPTELFDTVSGKVVPAYLYCDIFPLSNGRFSVLTCGLHSSGTRYRFFDTFSQAVDVAEKWAARRYRFVEEPARV